MTFVTAPSPTTAPACARDKPEKGSNHTTSQNYVLSRNLIPDFLQSVTLPTLASLLGERVRT